MAVCADCGTTYRRTKESPKCPSCGSTRARASAEAKGVAKAKAVPQGEPRKLVRQAAGERPARAAAAPRPAPEPAPEVQEEAHAPKHARAHRAPAGEAPVLDDAAKYGMYATLGFGLVVGIVCLFVFRAKAARREAEEAYQASVTAIHKELTALDVNDPAAAEKIVKLAEEKKGTWKDHDLAADIETLVVRARNSLTNSKEKRAATESFGAIEEELKKEGLSSERLRELRRMLDESEVRLADGGADLVARIALARSQAERQFAQRILDDAKSAAESGGTPRAGLAAYQKAEDELKTLLDRAFTAKNTELQAFYTPLYQQAIGKSDELASDLFRAEGESLAWVDCLASPQSGKWNASSVRGFSFRAAGDGQLQLIGPDLDAGKMAVISIGDAEQWRHYQLDIEFEIEKGDMDLFFRLGRGPNQNTISYSLRTNPGPDSLLKAGKEFSARISVIGSKFSVRFAGEDIDTPAPYDEDVRWTMNRKGAIGFVVQPGARAKFTRFKVRELR